MPIFMQLEPFSGCLGGQSSNGLPELVYIALSSCLLRLLQKIYFPLLGSLPRAFFMYAMCLLKLSPLLPCREDARESKAMRPHLPEYAPHPFCTVG